jgi:Holliday junction resolvase
MATSNMTKEEKELKRILDDKGYYTVRSAGSLGLADVVAIDKVVYAIEVKKRKDVYYPTKKAKEKLQELVNLQSKGIIPILAVKFVRKGWCFFDLRTDMRSKYEFDDILDLLPEEYKIDVDYDPDFGFTPQKVLLRDKS